MNDVSGGSLAERLREKADRYEAQAKRFRIAAEVVAEEERAMHGRRGRVSSDPRKSSTAMARRTIESQDREWKVPDLLDEMLRLGWESDAVNKINTVRTAASRLAERGEVERTAAGMYRRLALAKAGVKEPDADDSGGVEDEDGWAPSRDSEPPF